MDPQGFSFYLWRSVAGGFERYGDYLAGRILAKYGVPGRLATGAFLSTFSNGMRADDLLVNPEKFYSSFRRERTKLVRIEGRGSSGADRSSRSLISFPSPLFSGQGKNDLVRADLYQNSQQDSGRVIIWLGGLFMNFNSIDRLIARYLFSHGVDVCSMSLPYHGPRSCYGRSGFGFISTDPLGIGEAFIQAVLDVTKLHQILTENFGYKQIFGAGVSVSGNVLHIASFLKEFAGLTLINSGVSLAEMVWFSPNPCLRVVRHVLEAKSCTLDLLIRLWLMSDGTKFKIRPLCRRFLLANGLFDNYAKPDFALRLFQSLQIAGDAEMIIYPGSHYDNIFFMRPVFRNIKRFVDGKPVKQTKWHL